MGKISSSNDVLYSIGETRFRKTILSQNRCFNITEFVLAKNNLYYREKKFAAIVFKSGWLKINIELKS